MRNLKGILSDQEFFDSVEQVENFFNENNIDDSVVVQELMLDRTVFKDMSEAVEWCSGNYFEFSLVDEKETEYLFTQIDKVHFMEDSFSEVEIRRGVKATVGKLRASEVDYCLSLRNENVKAKKDQDGAVKFNEGIPHIIELAKVVTGYHPNYGQVEITKEMLQSFVKNFDEKATGVDISIDYDHETREAAGWLRSVFLSYDETTLLGEIRWTPKGALALADREFRYFSPEFHPNYVHPHNGTEHGATLLGGALVNRPFLKMEAIIELKNKNLKEGDSMSTIKLEDHQKALDEKDVEIKKLSEVVETSKKTLDGLKEENTKLSDELKEIKEAQEKSEIEAKNKKLFDDGKINKSQLDALNEGKELYEVLTLSEKIDTSKGHSESDKKVQLSDSEKAICEKLDISEEDFLKYNK